LAGVYTNSIYYDYQQATTRAWNESIHDLAGQLPDNVPIYDMLELVHQCIPELQFLVYWPPALPIWKCLGHNWNLDLYGCLGTIAKTHQPLKCHHNRSFRTAT
jgi:hypothetical protein